MNKNDLEKMKVDLIENLTGQEITKLYKSVFNSEYHYAFHDNNSEKANQCNDLLLSLYGDMDIEQWKYILDDFPYFLCTAYNEAIELAKQLDLHKRYINLITTYEQSFHYLLNYEHIRNDKFEKNMLAFHLGIIEYHIKEKLENKKILEELESVLDSETIERYKFYIKLHENRKEKKMYKKMVNKGVKEIKKMMNN